MSNGWYIEQIGWGGAPVPDLFVYNNIARYADLGLLGDGSTGLANHLAGPAWLPDLAMYAQGWNGTLTSPSPVVPPYIPPYPSSRGSQGIYRSASALSGDWTSATVKFFLVPGPDAGIAGVDAVQQTAAMQFIQPGLWDDYLLACNVWAIGNGPAFLGDDATILYRRCSPPPSLPSIGDVTFTEAHPIQALYQQYPYPGQIQYVASDYVTFPQISAWTGDGKHSARFNLTPGFSDANAFNGYNELWLSCSLDCGGMTIRDDGRLGIFGYDANRGVFIAWGVASDGTNTGTPTGPLGIMESADGDLYGYIDATPLGHAPIAALYIPTIERFLIWFTNGDLWYNDGSGYIKTTATHTPNANGLQFPWNDDHGFAVAAISNHVYTTTDGLTWTDRYTGSAGTHIAVGP
jgi:hypothetical protein